MLPEGRALRNPNCALQLTEYPAGIRQIAWWALVFDFEDVTRGFA